MSCSSLKVSLISNIPLKVSVISNFFYLKSALYQISYLKSALYHVTYLNQRYSVPSTWSQHCIFSYSRVSAVFTCVIWRRCQLTSYIVSGDVWMNMKHCWNDTDSGRPKYSGQKYPSATYPSQIWHWLCWDWGRVSAVRGRRQTA